MCWAPESSVSELSSASENDDSLGRETSDCTKGADNPAQNNGIPSVIRILCCKELKSSSTAPRKVLIISHKYLGAPIVREGVGLAQRMGDIRDAIARLQTL